MIYLLRNVTEKLQALNDLFTICFQIERGYMKGTRKKDCKVSMMKKNFVKIFAFVMVVCLCFVTLAPSAEAKQAAKKASTGTKSDEVENTEATTKKKTSKKAKKTKRVSKLGTAVSREFSAEDLAQFENEVITGDFDEDELRLLSCIIFCEAGMECYAGKLGVGIVVMNRIKSKRYPNNMHDVIYQKYQFSPTRNGSLNKAFKDYDEGRFTHKNHKDSIKAAKEALSGRTSVIYNGNEIDLTGYIGFAQRMKGYRVQIQHHQFI